ncbi:hypothetical protein [Parapedobacter composti]|nr:hypothetical protein [Parapedobacter composti]
MEARHWLTRCGGVMLATALLTPLAQGQQLPFAGRDPKGEITDPYLKEVSGLVAAGAIPHGLWTHNDSGDEARIFLIDDAARHRATYYLEGVTAYDWEDIGIMKRGEHHYLLVGDIGDNLAQRPTVTIQLVAEPAAIMGPEPLVDTIPRAKIRSYTLRYEDGARDAEAMFFDPIDKLVYIIAKRELGAGLYQVALPETASDTLTLRRVGRLPYTFITGADISPGGSEILVKNLLEVYYWKRREGETVPEALRRPATRLPYQPEPQGEAIAFAGDGSGYFTLSESLLGLKAILYFYRRL